MEEETISQQDEVKFNKNLEKFDEMIQKRKLFSSKSSSDCSDSDSEKYLKDGAPRKTFLRRIKSEKHPRLSPTVSIYDENEYLSLFNSKKKNKENFPIQAKKIDNRLSIREKLNANPRRRSSVKQMTSAMVQKFREVRVSSKKEKKTDVGQGEFRSILPVFSDDFIENTLFEKKTEPLKQNTNSYKRQSLIR